MASTTNERLKITLLGTGTPAPVTDRFGPSALVEAGGEKFLFDAGRGALQRLFQLKIPFAEVTGLFLTHLHSDHVVGLPDLWLTGWMEDPWGGRKVPLRVWGPTGTRNMMSHLEQAYEFDIRVRRNNYPREGIATLAEDFTEGVVYEQTDLKVTAFEVDHGPMVKPAFGYRLDYRGQSAVLSGDTTLNENLIAFSHGVDLLIHEVAAATDELLGTSELHRRIMRNHTSPEQAGEVFSRVNPKLAVYTHFLLFGGLTVENIIDSTRKKYLGPLEAGEDLMSIEVGTEVRVRHFAQ